LKLSQREHGHITGALGKILASGYRHEQVISLFLTAMKAQRISKHKFLHGAIRLRVGSEEFVFDIKYGMLIDRRGAMERARSLRSLTAKFMHETPHVPHSTSTPIVISPFPDSTDSDVPFDDIDDYGLDW
jgi:hypothetical protein